MPRVRHQASHRSKHEPIGADSIRIVAARSTAERPGPSGHSLTGRSSDTWL